MENTVYSDISVGQSASESATLTPKAIRDFADVTGDTNPAHLDPDFARKTIMKDVVGHGMWSGALFSRILGTQFPGPGTIYLGQTFKFRRPVYVNDVITATVTVTKKDDAKGMVWLDTVVKNQRGELVIEGEATILAPQVKFKAARAA
ncbi:MAG: MaoC family dehydratase [Burkholderiaceae bacterium]